MGNNILVEILLKYVSFSSSLFWIYDVDDRRLKMGGDRREEKDGSQKPGNQTQKESTLTTPPNNNSQPGSGIQQTKLVRIIPSESS